MGISYQIVDDTLDYFCQSDELGKEIGNDFKEKNDSSTNSMLPKR